MRQPGATLARVPVQHASPRASGAIAGLAVLIGCQNPSAHDRHDGPIVVLPEDADATTKRTADALVEYLGRIAGHGELVTVDALEDDAIADLGARVAIVLEGERNTDRFAAARLEALGPSGFAIDHDQRGDRTTLWLAANSRLSRQYAAYEVLRRLGTRFFHPEQEYVLELAPEQVEQRIILPTILQPGGADAIPDFAWRSWSFHSAHPLEHLEAFSDGDHPIDEAERVNDWIVKNRGNRFRGPGRGIAEADAASRRVDELEALRDTLGFPRGAGITLHNQQQGASAEIDPSLETPVQQQIADVVARNLADVPDAEWFGIHFGPTEFTTTPDLETVQWIEWAAAAARAMRPGVAIEINNHTTGTQPSPNFDDLGCANQTNDDGRADYYDLAFHTDPSYGVSVHTVMFYPLEGEARVYAQRSFGHKLCLMQRASAQGRPLTYFPEGSWWLSFDNAVPMYLPLYLATRHRDMELVRPLLARNGGSLTGYRMFDSGHEWGYWQQDYAVGLWAWNAELSLDDALGEILDPLCGAEFGTCAAKAEALAVMHEVIDHQRELFLERRDGAGRPGGLYTYFAGEDDADVIAASSGLEFRPVRPSFAATMAYGADERAAFESVDLAALETSADAYAGWTARMTELAGAVPDAATPWLEEIIDGLAIVGARADHSAALYRAVLAYADGEEGTAADAWARADAALRDATTIIARREAAYRYPAAQMFGGGLTQDTAVPNGTTYPYRVHTKTHLLTYWHNRHDEVATILSGGVPMDTGRVSIRDALADVGEPLEVSWPQLDALDGEVSFGVLGSLHPPAAMLDTGIEPGLFVVDGLLTAEGRELPVAGHVARTSVLARTPREGLTLTEPAAPTAQAVLSSVFPAIEWGLVATSGHLVIAHDGDDDGIVEHDATFATSVVIEADGFTAAPITLDIPVALGSGGSPVAVTLRDTVFSGVSSSGTFTDAIDASGELDLDDLVRALVELAGFDEQGALDTLGSLLGFDPASPPVTVPFAARFALTSG